MTLAALLAATLIQPAHASASADAPPAAATYRLSENPTHVEWSGPERPWRGDHRFQNVFCLRFPDGSRVTAMTEAMFNDHTLYFSRAMYDEARTSVYVVTSRLPATLSPAAEFNAQRERAEGVAARFPDRVSTSTATSALGPVVIERLRNVSEGSVERPFPFERSLFGEPNESASSLSEHRTLTNAGSRIEIAALQGFPKPLSAADEAAAAAALSGLLDRTEAALVECTLEMNLAGGQRGSDSHARSADAARAPQP